MPSGPKRRKAAKKKKEKEANTNPSTNNPQGNNELKSQEEKGSDGGEGSSPASHDHDDHLHPFNERNEEVEERDPSAAQPSAADAKSTEEVSSIIKIDEVVGGEEDGDVMIERDLKSEESSKSKNLSVVHIESVKESDYGNGNSSGNSNDETITEKNSKDEPDNSVKEATTFDELVKSIDSSHAKLTFITENVPVEKNGNSVVESSVNLIKAVEVVFSMSEVQSSDTGNASLDDKVSASLSCTPFTESTNGAEHVKDSDTPDCSENQPLVTSAPRMVQKTSWLSCCGLFEVLSGSNR